MVGKFGFGLGLKKNSQFTNAFSVGILKLRENLLINKLYEKWIKQGKDWNFNKINIISFENEGRVMRKSGMSDKSQHE